MHAGGFRSRFEAFNDILSFRVPVPSVLKFIYSLPDVIESSAAHYLAIDCQRNFVQVIALVNRVMRPKTQHSL